VKKGVGLLVVISGGKDGGGKTIHRKTGGRGPGILIPGGKGGREEKGRETL